MVIDANGTFVDVAEVVVVIKDIGTATVIASKGDSVDEAVLSAYMVARKTTIKPHDWLVGISGIDGTTTPATIRATLERRVAA